MVIDSDVMFDWLVIYPGAEFIVQANTLRQARYAVERKAKRLGLRLYGKQHYDMYRLHDAIFMLSDDHKMDSKAARLTFRYLEAAARKYRPGLDLTGKIDMDEVRRAYYGEE